MLCHFWVQISGIILFPLRDVYNLGQCQLNKKVCAAAVMFKVPKA